MVSNTDTNGNNPLPVVAKARPESPFIGPRGAPDENPNGQVLVADGGRWDWNAIITPKVVISGVLLLLPVVWIYWSDVMSWEQTWRTNDNWGFGYLVLPLALWLAHMRFMERPPRRIQSCWWGLGLIGFGIIVRLAGITSMFGYVAQISIIFILAGMVLYLLGWQIAHVAWVPVAYLTLAIPWPDRVYDAFAQPMQRFAALIVEQVLSVVGVAVARRGNVLSLLEMPPALRDLGVTEQCSGLRLLLAFVALGVLVAFIARRASWERILIVISTVPIAIFCNCVRVFWMAMWSLGFWRLADAATRANDAQAAASYNTIRDAVLDPGHPMFPGAPSWLDWHSSLGYVMLALAFFLLWAETKFLDRLFLPEKDDTEPAETQQT